MKTLTIFSSLLTITALIGGLFCTTPNGEPATHQLFVAGFMALFTIGCEIERRKEK